MTMKDVTRRGFLAVAGAAGAAPVVAAMAPVAGLSTSLTGSTSSTAPGRADFTTASARQLAGLAYNLLFEQQAVLQPGLTIPQFNAWLVGTVTGKAKAAAQKRGGK